MKKEYKAFKGKRSIQARKARTKLQTLERQLKQARKTHPELTDGALFGQAAENEVAEDLVDHVNERDEIEATEETNVVDPEQIAADEMKPVLRWEEQIQEARAEGKTQRADMLVKRLNNYLAAKKIARTKDEFPGASLDQNTLRFPFEAY